jgi:tetratricopeptide (TPR) repeat protein
MLDVHAPEHGINGVRDFFLHLFTITVGLLIALGLEAGAEALHHRHQREEAEATIRREISENHDELQKLQVDIKREGENLEKALAFLEDLRDGKHDDPRGINLGWHSSPLQSAGWRTASDTGALIYISYERVQRFAEAYQEQQLFEDATERGLEHFEILDTYVARGQNPVAMKSADIETAIPDLRRALADLSTMNDIARGTMKVYESALKD